MEFQVVKDHLRQVDPVLYQAIAEVDLPPRSYDFTPDQYFQRLAEDIIGQQLSVKVAEVLTTRFRQLFNDQLVTPEAVLSIPDDQLRAIGMSWAKVKYVKDLADKTQAKAVKFELYADWPDDEIIANLIQVKGIGRWTCEMFLMFTLGRPDVFSAGDLGLIRSMQRVYGLSEAEIRKQGSILAARWAPYRTQACLALWRLLDNT